MTSKDIKKLMVTKTANTVIQVNLVSSLLSLIILKAILPPANKTNNISNRTKFSCLLWLIINTIILAMANATITLTANAFFFANRTPFIYSPLTFMF